MDWEAVSDFELSSSLWSAFYLFWVKIHKKCTRSWRTGAKQEFTFFELTKHSSSSLFLFYTSSRSVKTHQIEVCQQIWKESKISDFLLQLFHGHTHKLCPSRKMREILAGKNGRQILCWSKRKPNCASQVATCMKLRKAKDLPLAHTRRVAAQHSAKNGKFALCCCCCTMCEHSPQLWTFSWVDSRGPLLSIN